jgi:hypothetical protein
MDANRQATPATPPTGKPNVAPWSGSGLIAFDARPFARSLLHWYAFAVLIGYCSVVAWAMSQHSAWVIWWIDFWTPAADALQPFFPIFKHVDGVLEAKGLSERAPVFRHLIAFGWIITVPIFAFLTWTVWHLSRDELVRFASMVPADRQAIMLGGSYLFFQFTLLSIFLGFGFDNSLLPVSHWSALLSIGFFFCAALMFGIAIQVSFRGLMVACELEKEQRRRLTDGGRTNIDHR